MKMRIISLVFFLAILGCTRSTGFETDQQYYREGVPDGKFAERVSKMGQPKQRIVVLPFLNKTPVQQGDLGNYAADEVKRELFLTKRLIVPMDVRTRLSTQDFVEGDQVRVSQLIREGRRMGVGIIAIGRITQVVFRQKGDEVGLLRQMQSVAAAEMELKLFDVNAGREIMAIGRSGEASNNSMVALESGNLKGDAYRTELIKLAIRNAARGIIPSIVKSVDKMGWEGRIAKINGSLVYVNAGRTSGLVGGDILKVLTPGDEVYDPESGAYLGKTQGQLKGTLEIVDFIGNDASVANIHTGGQFQPGDIVRLY